MLVVWVKKTDFIATISEVEGKIPSITGLATNSEITAVENKIPGVSSLVKKMDYATEITSIKNDYVTNVALNDRHEDLIQKKIDTEVTKINDKIASDSSEGLLYNNRLKKVKDRIDGLERYASYFRGKNYFDGDDGTQNALIF